MDPQYHQFILVLATLSQLVVLSMLLERALVMVFENGLYRRFIDRRVEVELVKMPDASNKTTPRGRPHGLRGILALIAAIVICCLYRFDVLAVLFAAPPAWVGMVFTGFVTAGGSAGAIAVVQGFLGFNRDTRDAVIAAKSTNAQATAEVAKLEAELKKVLALTAADVAKAEADAKKAAAQALTAEANVRTDAARAKDPKASST